MRRCLPTLPLADVTFLQRHLRKCSGNSSSRQASTISDNSSRVLASQHAGQRSFGRPKILDFMVITYGALVYSQHRVATLRTKIRVRRLARATEPLPRHFKSGPHRHRPCKNK